jgi:hypothetical protein
MKFYVRASGSGKRIRVFDRIAGAEAFNRHLDPSESAEVAVASNDGQTGNVDIYKQMTAQNPEYVHETDYDVRAEETVDVDDP